MKSVDIASIRSYLDMYTYDIRTRICYVFIFLRYKTDYEFFNSVPFTLGQRLLATSLGSR